MSLSKKTPIQIANEWYHPDEIFRCIQAAKKENMLGKRIPRDVDSREFAEWLTDQYRLAMAKGIELGRQA